MACLRHVILKSEGRNLSVATTQTFGGGVHPREIGNGKNATQSLQIVNAAAPARVMIAMAQHAGAPAVCCVKVGQTVNMGQIIGEAQGFISAPVHASVSGKVVAITTCTVASGKSVPAVVIDNDFEDRWDESVKPCDNVDALSAADIASIAARCGIVGMGGAAFPTNVKLDTSKLEEKPDTLIVNGSECEPYLTSDHRIMVENAEQIVDGIALAMKASGVACAKVGIEDNKPDAIAHLTALAASYAGVRVVPLKVQYPQGGEKQLIAAVTGREVPPPPALPIDVGAVVCNASTTLAVYEAVQKNKPLVERVVTVTGKGVARPCNLLVRMGTPVSALLEAAGGLPEDAGKVLNGGPMMGRAMVNLDSPVTKGCSGITVLGGREALRGADSACIKCAKCVSACPMGLEPYLLSKLTRKQAWERLETEQITNCIECGCCQFTCPAYLPLLDYVRLGKQRVMGLIRARAAANAPKK